MNIARLTLSILSLTALTCLGATPPSLLPLPAEVSWKEGDLEIK